MKAGDMDKQFQNSVMVALLPTTTDWSTIAFPHMTLVYVGEIPDLQYYVRSELAKDALIIASTTPRITLDVLGPDVFGEGNDEVEVLVLQPTRELIMLQKPLDCYNQSKHPFNPHVTVGPVGSVDKIPKRIVFDRICLSWGEDNLEYKLLRK